MMIIAKKINDQNLFISELQKRNCFTVQDIKKKNMYITHCTGHGNKYYIKMFSHICLFQKVSFNSACL